VWVGVGLVEGGDTRFPGGEDIGLGRGLGTAAGVLPGMAPGGRGGSFLWEPER
jgi:hypothetical protein